MKLSLQIFLAFSLVILLSVADSYTNFLLSQKVEQNTAFLTRSEAIMRVSNITHKTIIDMQSSFRGYLLTDDSTFLDSYYKGMKIVPQYLKEQKQLVGEDPKKQQILDSIQSMHKRWVQYSRTLIISRQQLPQSADFEEAYSRLFEGSLKKHVGKRLNDSISAKFNRLDRMEYKTRALHSQMLIESIDRTHTISLIFLVMTILVGICSTLYIMILISKRIASMVGMADKISKGDFSIVRDNRNDELTSLSRSLNIMSNNLRINIRELENRNAELNKFAYVVSHDLKAPIRGIHNVVKWIEEDLNDELSPQLKKYLTIIPQRTKRMEALINGLLDYARISRKTSEEWVDTNALVNELAEALVPRNFQLHIDKLPELYTERLKLEQVFANLISNAVKYTPQEKAAITISCEEHPAYYEFTVSDNGIGIDPEYHEKIFEIFQTLREKNEKESTGIGLAIVKKIIEEQQGHINVRSEAGKGARFTFTWRKNNLNEKA